MTLLELMWQVLATLAVAAVLAAAIRAIMPQVGLVRALGVSLVVVVMTIPLTRWAGTLLGIIQEGQLAVSAGLAMVVAALVLACVVVVAIMLLVALEAVVPTGSVPGPVSLAREGVKACRRSLRYAHLAWIVSRSGLGAALREGPQSPAFGQALVRTLNQAGVTFVKLGQILSTRADLLPASLTEALEELQSSAAPVHGSQVRELLTQEWGASPDEVLHHLEPEPFAAASVAEGAERLGAEGRGRLARELMTATARPILVEGSSTRTCTRATSCCSTMAGWVCWTLERSASSTRRRDSCW